MFVLWKAGAFFFSQSDVGLRGWSASSSLMEGKTFAGGRRCQLRQRRLVRAVGLYCVVNSWQDKCATETGKKKTAITCWEMLNIDVTFSIDYWLGTTCSVVSDGNKSYVCLLEVVYFCLNLVCWQTELFFFNVLSWNVQ